MWKFISNCWKHRNTEFKVTWDTTNLAYTRSGPRREGAHLMVGFLQAWWWGQVFTFWHPRGAVFLDLAKA
jgi:hypothetical protein